MNNARNIEPDLRLKAAQLNIEMGDWLHTLAPWQVISHLTFSWEASIWSAQRCYEKFMRNEMRGVSYFYALEENPGRDGYHAHALWCDCKCKSRQQTWRIWFERYGRNRIEPVNSRDDVADYCAKYVCKEGAWWNVKLLSHRHPALPAGVKVSILYGDMKKAEPIGFRVKLPAGGMIAPHTHPVDERVTVISGAFAMGEGEKFDKAALKDMPVGSVAVFPRGCTMFGFAREETIIQVNAEGPWGINYINPADDPRKK